MLAQLTGARLHVANVIWHASHGVWRRPSVGEGSTADGWRHSPCNRWDAVFPEGATDVGADLLS